MSRRRERIEIALRPPWFLLALVALLLAGAGLFLGSYVAGSIGVVDAFDLAPIILRVLVAALVLGGLAVVARKYLRHPAFRIVIDHDAITVPSFHPGERAVTLRWSDIVALEVSAPRLVLVTSTRRYDLLRAWFHAPWSLAQVRAEIENRRAAV